MEDMAIAGALNPGNWSWSFLEPARHYKATASECPRVLRRHRSGMSRQISSIFFCARMLLNLRAPSIHDGLSRNRAVTQRERRALLRRRARDRSDQDIPNATGELCGKWTRAHVRL